MKKSVRRAIVTVVLCGIMVAMSAGPAFSEDLGPVPNHAIVGSVDLFGMQEADARAVISQEASVTLLPPLTVKVAGMRFTVQASRCLRLNVSAMLAKAYGPSTETTFTVPRICTVSSAPVVAFTSLIANRVRRAPRNATYYYSGGKLRWRPAVYGRAFNAAAATGVITKALAAEAASGTARPTLYMSYRSAKPAVTNALLGRAILIDLSQRRLWLYDHSRLVKTFRVAVGMPGYPTPRGTFKVIAKVRNPSWGNPGSAWASGMPSYIAPGPGNPLGTRALYLSASGIRIHGTSKTSSIGHAASHGCIRLTNHNVETLYPLVPVGTKVFIVR